MSKKQFGFIGVGIFGTVLLCTMLRVSFVTSGGSQAKLVTLNDEAMAQLVGGVSYRKGNLIQSQSGSIAHCNYPSSCPTQSFTFKPTIYSCFTCSPSQIKYFKAKVYKKIISWCDNTVASECPYKRTAYNKRDDCEISLNTSC